ncbi:MAG: hypothetical protein AB7E51_14985 [Pseudodesulfovibrio sp.]|uniref:hypothetical protein n=1 Tax=Pseudodesulfovibrio sp. TaxID=2035812 RepID=UPI003D09D25C
MASFQEVRDTAFIVWADSSAPHVEVIKTEYMNDASDRFRRATSFANSCPKGYHGRMRLIAIPYSEIDHMGVGGILNLDWDTVWMGPWFGGSGPDRFAAPGTIGPKDDVPAESLTPADILEQSEERRESA